MIEHRFEWVSEAEQIISKGVAALRPEVLDTETAKGLVERFAHIERLGAADKALAGGRVRTRGRGAKRGIALRFTGWRGPPRPR